MNVLADNGAVDSWLWDVLQLLTIPALILLNGLFVSAEFALVSVRKTRIEELAAHGVIGARAVLKAISTDLSRYGARLEGFGTEFAAILSRQSEERG